jgi:hypothetical protein
MSAGTARKKLAHVLLILAVGLLVFSCAHSTEHYAQVDQCLLSHDYDSAHMLIKNNEETYGERNAALYHLEQGIIAHFASRYEDSNKHLSRAECIMDELYTKSVSKQAASFLVNDNTIPYRGEDFENAMVNMFMALNYVGLGLWEDALVEARKVDNKLNVINAQYEEDKRNVYKEDAFVRFLMGVLYEAEGETNDAFISYRKAEEIYRTDYLENYGVSAPPCLIENLLTSAQAMDFHEELAELQEKYPGVASTHPTEKKNMAEVYFLHYNGLGPEKVEKNWTVPMPDAYAAKIAYPGFEKRSYQISRGEITLKSLTSGSSYRFSTLLMEDITSIAINNLGNRINRIKAKAIARATTKYAAAKAAEAVAENQGGALLGFVTKVVGNIAANATENADVRHWRLLPAEIRVGKVAVPPGEYEGQIQFVDANGGVVVSKDIEPFTVNEAGKKFFTYRTLR